MNVEPYRNDSHLPDIYFMIFLRCALLITYNLCTKNVGIIITKLTVLIPIKVRIGF